MQVERLPITKYFTPASDELKSSFEKETSIYNAKLCNSTETNKDNKSLDDTINIIPIMEIKIIIENSGRLRDESFLTIKQKYITKPAQIKITDLRKEPNESITKKLLKISSKRKISLRTKNWVRNIRSKDK